MLEKLVNDMTHTIHAIQGVKPKVTHIPVKYIRAIGPHGEEILLSEMEAKNAKEMGLSLRRIEE